MATFHPSISSEASYSSPLRFSGYTGTGRGRLPDHGHGLEGKVLFLIVDEPGRALGDVVEAEGEEDEEDAGDEAQPVPGEGAAHDVTADDAQGGHHLVFGIGSDKVGSGSRLSPEERSHRRPAARAWSSRGCRRGRW